MACDGRLLCVNWGLLAKVGLNRESIESIVLFMTFSSNGAKEFSRLISTKCLESRVRFNKPVNYSTGK